MLEFFRIVVVKMHRRLLDLGGSPFYEESMRQMGGAKYLYTLKGIMEKFYKGMWDYDENREVWKNATERSGRVFGMVGVDASKEWACARDEMAFKEEHLVPNVRQGVPLHIAFSHKILL